jgi:hypothetical protein
MPDHPPSTSHDQWKDHFDRHISYRELMSGSRRKPIPPFGAPAITRHIGLWIPDRCVSDSVQQVDRGAWIAAIEKFIGDLHARLKSKAYQPRTLDWPVGRSEPQLRLLDSLAAEDRSGRSPDADATRLQSFRFAFEWQSMPVMISFEVREEHLAITTTIDLSTWKLGAAGASTFPKAAQLQSALETLNEVTTKRFAKVQVGKGESTKTADRQALQIPYDVIYHKVWDCLDNDIFGGLFRGEDAKHIGQLFIDLRGLVASQGGKDFIALPGHAVTAESLEKRIGGKIFGDPEAIRRVDALMPFLTAYRADLSKSQEQLEPVEVAAEKFLYQRVLYISALGSQWPQQDAPFTPLTFMIYAADNYPRQLARLIDRGHMLAAARLAAIYDRDLILKADGELRRLEAEIEGLVRKQHGQQDRAQLEAAAEELKKRLPQFAQKLAEIGLQLGEDNKPLVGGLARRVVMSRFYQKQFDGLVRGFRHTRIEGFPTYTEVVIRRLGGVYDHIDAIGETFANLQETVAGLHRSALTARSIELQEETKKQTDASVQIQKDTSDLQKAFVKLQEGADFAFFLVPFPYYLSSLLTKPFSDGFLHKYPWIKWLALGLSVSLGVLLAYRHQLSETKPGRHLIAMRRNMAEQLAELILRTNTFAIQFKRRAREIAQQAQEWIYDRPARIRASRDRIASAVRQLWRRAKDFAQSAPTHLRDRAWRSYDRTRTRIREIARRFRSPEA